MEQNIKFNSVGFFSFFRNIFFNLFKKKSKESRWESRTENKWDAEYERIDEMICLIEHLTCKTHILARTVSNPIPFTGSIPTDRQLLLNELRSVKERLSEEQLRSYRDSIESL